MEWMDGWQCNSALCLYALSFLLEQVVFPPAVDTLVAEAEIPGLRAELALALNDELRRDESR